MDDFISLAALVRSAQAARVGAMNVTEPAVAQSTPAPESATSSAPATSAAATSVVRNVTDFAHADLVQEVALMRLAVVESFERAKTTLLEALAADVLGRELALAPVDLEAIASRVLACFTDLQPVAIVVSPSDAERVHAGVPVRVDATLAAGDIMLDVRDGTLESRFLFRLQSALDRAVATGAA